MIPNITSGLEKIAHFPQSEWAGHHARLEKIEALLRIAAEQAQEETGQALHQQLTAAVSDLEAARKMFEWVADAVDTEFLEGATGLTGLLLMLNGLDDHPLPASYVYSLLRPLALRLDDTQSAFNTFIG